MALPAADELRDLSIETGYPVETLETVTRLLDLLPAIVNDPVLGPHVALKGGTAINGFHSEWPRLSVDIDLTHIGLPSRSSVDKVRPRGDAALRKILLERGYGIEDDPTARPAGGTWVATYTPTTACPSL